MLIPDAVHPSWDRFLSSEIREELADIEKKIGENFNPVNRNNILRFLTVDLDRVLIIWLGQDVYPAKGVATGRSFEVGTIQNWDDSFRQVSLKNIIRLIHKNYNGFEDYKEIKPFKDIQKEIRSGKFPVKQPKEWFNSLEEQGVLFLNSSFTCEIGNANSHKKIWESFSNKLLKFISVQRPDIIWFLWGNEAIAKKEFIQDGIFYESRHPMMCSEKYDNDFLKFDGFAATWDLINWLG